MSRPYTFRKHGGDDQYSYAVFGPNGMIMNGLNRNSARHECEKRNPSQPVYPTKVSMRGAYATYKLANKSGVLNFGEVIYGYAIGERGHWTVYDGSFSKSSDHYLYGNKLGVVTTLPKAGALALSNHESKNTESPS